MLALYRAGPPVRGARRLPRRARRRSSSRSASSRAPSCGALHEAILAQDPALDLPAAPEPAPAARRARRRAGRARLLVGRRRGAARRHRGVRRHPRARARGAARHRRERRRASSIPTAARITAQYAVGRAPSAVAAGGGSVWVANQLDGTVSRIDRARTTVVTIPVGGAPAALAFGAGSLWVADGDGRDVAQVDPGVQQGAAADRGRQRAAVAGRRRRARCGSPRASTAACGGSSSPRPRHATDPARREADRDRRRRRRGVGGERGGGHRDPRSTRASGAVVAADQRRQRADAPSRWARARCGSSTAATARSRASIRPRTRCRDGARRHRPDGGRGRREAVWVAGGEDGTVVRVDPARPARAHAAAHGEQPDRARRSPAARCGRRRPPRRRRTGAGRCACYLARVRAASRRLAERRRLYTPRPGC